MSQPDPSQPAPPKRSWSDLGPRFVSAAVLIGITVLGLVVGSYVFAALVGVVFAGAYREWEVMATRQAVGGVGLALTGLLGVSPLAFPAFGLWGVAAVVGLACLVALGARGEAVRWRIGGLAVFGLVIASIMSIRGADTLGIYACIFVLVVVWMTDSAAFFTGRQIGGEKLAPDISPSKTWSGALGGLALGTISGLVVFVLLTESPWWIGALLAVAVSVLAQLGDLLESATKRRFRVKDSGDIIPGHGGLMDRLDSLTLSAIFVFAVGALHRGLEAVAAGVLIW